MLLVFFIIIGISFVILMAHQIEKKKESDQNFIESGYHPITNKIFKLRYLGGIKTLSANNNVGIILLKEGISFNYKDIIEDKTYKYIIPFENITDIYIDSQQSIQEKVSLGKLVIFGVLAFGMKGKQSKINEEYIILKVYDEEDYSIVLGSESIQSDINTLIELKNNYEKILEKTE